MSAIRNVVLPAIALMLLTHLFLGQITIVQGQSMQPNFRPADRLIMEKMSLYFREPQRNDIVVLDRPESTALTIKRITGIPGDTLEIQQGHIFVNGSEVAPPYDIAPRWRVIVGGKEVSAPSRYGESHSSYGPIVLADNTYFVLGDNRDNSNDSRAFGPVPRRAIIGRIWIRYWPPERFVIFQ